MRSVDADTAPPDLREVVRRKVSRVMSNNFAFGGINTSLIIAAPS